MTEHEFDIAVSFAGEDREFVAKVVEKLKERDVSVFYDFDYTAEMWGEDLVAFLQDVYRRRARFAILFISRHYLERKWTNHERQSVQDRALQQGSPYILPVHLDDTELPGLHSTTGHIDARTDGIDRIVDVVVQKLGQTRTEALPRFNGRTPRTSEEVAILLGERPPGWEYLLYAGMIKQEIDRLGDKYRDHQIEYAPRNGRFVKDDEAAGQVRQNLAVLAEMVESAERVLNLDAQAAAFGTPDVPGEPDPDRIVHLASRFVRVYEEFLDWAAGVRGAATASSALRRVFDVEARWANEPIERMREFADDFVEFTDTLVGRLKAGENIVLQIPVHMELDEKFSEQHQSAWAAFLREVGA